MRSHINLLRLHLHTHADRYVFIFLVLTSILSSMYFYQGNKQLLYGDALSRLDISRKIFDNLTPGMAQLGNVWLPLPHLLMLPFVTSDFLWHSGLAGTIVSSFFFILGGLYLFKTSRVLTESTSAAFLGLLVYAFNINLMYLQTTAMSEAPFLGLLPVLAYYFLVWMKDQKMSALIKAGVVVTALTLVRYEALSILLTAMVIVIIFSYLKSKSYARSEANIILFTTIAGLGFILWSIYLAAIFGDPLYWVHYYASAPSIPNQVVTHVVHLGIFASIWWYFTAVVWMNGIIPVLFSIIGSIVLLFRAIRERRFYLLAIFLQLAMFAFMVLTLMRNTPIQQPVLSVSALLSPATNLFPEFNIRYGMLMLPFIALAVSYMFRKNIALKILFLGFFSIQIYTYFNPIFTTIYQFNISIASNFTEGQQRDKDFVAYLKQNYTGGLILISATKHDPQMFQLGVDYKTFIHEGTAKYWRTSLRDPSVYATWVMLDTTDKEDLVTKALKDAPVLTDKYNLVYNSSGENIYKLKDEYHIATPGQ